MAYDIIGRFSIGHLHFDEIDSTNAFAGREASRLWSVADAPNIWVITAGSQSAGRGQRGSVWFSEKNENLLMTLLLRPSSLLVDEYYALSMATALAFKEAMQRFGLNTVLKWPNDLYVGNRKLAGILLETDINENYVSQAIIGAGLNVNQKSFAEMSRFPVSMAVIAKRDFDCDVVLRTVLEEFVCFYEMIGQGRGDELTELYEKSLMGYGSKMLFRDSESEFEATVAGVKKNGALLLRRDDGSISSYAFKEVELVALGY